MQIDQYQLKNKVDEILFSPSFTQLPYRDLADWIIADNLPVRMQLQLHKLIWGEERGR
jgi:7-carboxy-7-deazaguanine synthase